MRTFTVIWFGQLVSIVGTAMTRFALLIWAYEQTGNATTVALLGFFSYTPYVLASPIAGIWVDRLDRRLVMILADLAAGLMTIALLLLFRNDALHIWHLFLIQGLSGAFEAFQIPAYTAATTTLIPKQYFARASGMRSLAGAGGQVLAPFLAGVLLVAVGIQGVMLIDVATFLTAIATLFLVRIPRPKPAGQEEEGESGTNLWRQLSFGTRYILQRPGLLGLMLIFVGINFFAALTYFSILPALVLARTGGDEIILGNVMASLGAGGIVGGILVTLWGGPRPRIHGALAFTSLSFLLGDSLFALGRSPLLWIAAGFLAAVFIPFIVAANRSIWQSKVHPAIQGRVLSVQGMLQQATMPLGYLLAGPLADHVFGPAMDTGGALTPIFGPLVGTGPGAGIALMFLFTAIGGTLMGLGGYLFPAVRNVETELPDYDEVVGRITGDGLSETSWENGLKKDFEVGK